VEDDIEPSDYYRTLPNGSELSKRELFSWFMYDWSNSACSSVVIRGFLPLLTQDCALGAAGFPRIAWNNAGMSIETARKAAATRGNRGENACDSIVHPLASKYAASSGCALIHSII
jgi:MFS-type transporter involved in bile tolerance (Atg22 family)